MVEMYRIKQALNKHGLLSGYCTGRHGVLARMYHRSIEATKKGPCEKIR